MTIRPRTLEWYNANSHRSYPFADDVKEGAVSGPSGTFSIPEDMLLDFFMVYYHYTGPVAVRPLVLSTVTFSTSGVTRDAQLVFTYANLYTASVTVPINAAWPYTASGYTEAYDIRVTVGRGLAVLSQEAVLDGTYTASSGQYIRAGLISVQDRHRVTSLKGDTDDSVSIHGDVYLENGYSTLFYLDTSSNTIRVAASPGAGAGYPCERVDSDRPHCGGVLFNLAGAYGPDVSLIGGNGVEVIPKPDDHRIDFKIRIEDMECAEHE